MKQEALHEIHDSLVVLILEGGLKRMEVALSPEVLPNSFLDLEVRLQVAPVALDRVGVYSALCSKA